MVALVFIFVCVIVVFVLAIRRASLEVWAIAAAAATLVWQTGLVDGRFHAPMLELSSVIGWLPAIVLGLLSISALRRSWLTGPVYHAIKKALPRVSDTEQQALDAGTIGFDAEIFSGNPDWERLRAVPPIVLTPEERAFLDGPTAELCGMINDWQIRHTEREIPEPIWDFAKRHGFLGMLISKEHGGLGFSPQAQSLILGKIASRSADVCTIVMVPNSLGPGELIEKYGTDAQKHHFLPRLAKGLDVPCFSLTGPTSGSDAATMRDIGYCDARRARRQGRARGPAFLGQALHHARPQGDARRPRVPPVRSREPPRQGRGRRHHGGAHSGGSSGRPHRPPPSAVGCGFPERPQLGQGRLHPDGLDHRRRQDGRPGLADADGMPRRRPRDLAAVVGCRRRQGDAALHHRLWPHPQAVRPARRQDGGPRRAADPHDRDGLRQRGRPCRHRGDGIERREALGHLRDHEVPVDRAAAPVGQRRHGSARRARHLRRPVELSPVGLPDGPGRHHRRGREYPDALADHVRAGGAALASLPVRRDQGLPGP